MGLEIFQKVVEETSQNPLQQIDSKSIVRISNPTSSLNFSKKSSARYINKTQQHLILTIEDEYFEKNPRAVAEKIFPSGWHFQPKDPSKTQKFYEFILVDIDSLAIKHYKNKTKPSDKNKANK